MPHGRSSRGPVDAFWISISTTIPSPRTLKSAILFTRTRSSTCQCRRFWKRPLVKLAPQEQVQQRTVEQVVNVLVEMRGRQSHNHRSRVGTPDRPGDGRRPRGNWRLSSADLDLEAGGDNTVGAKRFHGLDVLFQPCSKIHDTSFQKVMKFDIDYPAGYVF